MLIVLQVFDDTLEPLLIGEISVNKNAGLVKAYLTRYIRLVFYSHQRQIFQWYKFKKLFSKILQLQNLGFKQPLSKYDIAIMSIG